MSGGSAFQSLTVLGKSDILLLSVLCAGVCLKKFSGDCTLFFSLVVLVLNLC